MFLKLDKMRKIFIVMFCLVNVLCTNAIVKYVTVEKKSGEKFSFLLEDNPVISFKDGCLVVNGNPETSYAIDGVKNYHFSESDQTDVQNLGVDVLRIVSLDNDAISVEHAKAGTSVELYDAAGVRVMDVVVDQSGAASIVLPVKKGVYVLSVGGKSVKLIRK